MQDKTQTPSSDAHFTKLENSMAQALYDIINMKSCLLADAQVIATDALPEDWTP